MSLKNQIIKMAMREYPNWLRGGQFQDLAFQMDYLAENAARRCRDLVKENRLEKRLIKNKVEYRFIPIKAETPEAREQSLLELATR